MTTLNAAARSIPFGITVVYLIGRGSSSSLRGRNENAALGICGADMASPLNGLNRERQFTSVRN